MTIYAIVAYHHFITLTFTDVLEWDIICFLSSDHLSDLRLKVLDFQLGVPYFGIEFLYNVIVAVEKDIT